VSQGGRVEATCIACQTAVPLADSIRFRKDGFDIAQCASCGLLFRVDLPDEEDLKRIYDGSYFSRVAGDTKGQGYDDYVGDAALHKEIAARRLEQLAALVPPGRLLDVGSAAGFFVSEAVQSGWDARGVDISPDMVAWGTANLGVKLDRGTLETVDGAEGWFDVVTMWDYIEHSIDPERDLRIARTLLRSGGILALSTGDAASVAAKVSGSRWHLLTPRHHNYFFTAASLEVLLHRLGFTVISAAHPGARYSLRYLTYKLRTIVDVTPVQRLATLLEKSRFAGIQVPVNLGDIITVFARSK
jgi:2-polyprenyl-3-methyl-5-hydroxy-6-metoxy-1,4-benzoquinol methylase